MERVILHCDLNNFYASVETLMHPEYRTKPLAVCGDPKMRHGIVLAKNDLAKKYGIKTGDTVRQAMDKCPSLLLAAPTFSQYLKYSNIAKSIYKKYTDRVESFGMDECWLDVTDCRRYGSGKEIADEIRNEIKHTTGLTISVGVSFTKILAKLGSDMKKPDATTVIDREVLHNVVWKLPCSEMIMVGAKTNAKLQKLGIRTLGELANAPLSTLTDVFGTMGNYLHKAANGIEQETVRRYDDYTAPKSISNGTTTPRDILNVEEAKTVIYALCEMVAMRLRKHSMRAGGVSLSVREVDLSVTSKQKQLARYSSSASEIAATAIELLATLHDFAKSPLRSITVGTFNLVANDETQLSLFDSDYEKEERLDSALDEIRTKFGFGAVKRAVVMSTDVMEGGNLHEDDEYKPFKH